MTLTVPNKSSNCGASPKSVNTDLMFRSVFLKNDVAFLPTVAYNKFENTMTQVPTVSQLVPMVAGEVTGMDYHWDYIYEPDAQEALGNHQIVARRLNLSIPI
jgi:F0F1-type ATP synthase gamma subunit